MLDGFGRPQEVQQGQAHAGSTEAPVEGAGSSPIQHLGHAHAGLSIPLWGHRHWSLEFRPPLVRQVRRAVLRLPATRGHLASGLSGPPSLSKAVTQTESSFGRKTS